MKPDSGHYQGVISYCGLASPVRVGSFTVKNSGRGARERDDCVSWRSGCRQSTSRLWSPAKGRRERGLAWKRGLPFTRKPFSPALHSSVVRCIRCNCLYDLEGEEIGDSSSK